MAAPSKKGSMPLVT